MKRRITRDCGASVGYFEEGHERTSNQYHDLTANICSGMHVVVGFMPAFKYRQKNPLMVFEHGHKAHGYVFAEERQIWVSANFTKHYEER
jgi:hypothetical protein